MKTVQLRPYQQEAVSVIVPQIGKKDRILISMPTGTGRTLTLVMALYEYYQHNPVRILFLVNRRVLKEQLIRVVEEVFGQGTVSDRLDEQNDSIPVYIGTVQWLAKYKNTIDPHSFDIIVYIDHESMRFGWENGDATAVLNYFKPKTSLSIGSDVTSPHTFSQEVAYRYSLHDAISDGVLRPIHLEMIEPTVSDLFDYHWKPGTDILESDDAISALTDFLVDKDKNLRTIVLVPNQSNAIRLSESINRHMNYESYSFPYVSKTPEGLRQQALLAFRQEEKSPKILVCAGTLLTGINLPDIDRIIVLRKFQRLSTLVRTISSFLSKGTKESPVVMLDFMGNKYLKELAVSGDEYSWLPVSGVAESEAKALNYSVLKTDVNYAERNNLDGVLGVQDIADELADVISTMPCEQGCMIGIFGKWGRGKTFLMNKTWQAVKIKNPLFVKIDFQAWKYQDTPAIWAYLYEKFADQYHGATGYWTRFRRRIRLNFIREGYGTLIWFGIFFILSLILGFAIPMETKLRWLWKFVTAIDIVLLCKIIFFSIRNRKSAIALFKKYYAKTSFVTMLGVQEEVQKELRSLVKAWGKEHKEHKGNKEQDHFKLLLFVDDIDRCSEEKIIRIIDSLRVMLDDPELSKRIVIVAAIDERILKIAIEHKYTELIASEDDSKKWIAEYIDKLFLVGLKLGDLTPEEIDEFFIAFTNEDREQGDLPSLEELSTDVANGQISPNETPESSSYYDDQIKEDNFEDREEDEFKEDEQQIYGDSLTHFLPMPERKTLEKKLTVEEINLLRKVLHTSTHKTPRQVRVFYYRYIIAKHLLIKLSPRTIWTTIPESTESFIKLLKILSDSTDHADVISREKLEVAQVEGDSYKIKLLDGIEVPKTDYKILLTVLDLVIGY